MLYLLDTNACTDLINEHPQLGARVGRVAAPDEATTCVVVRGEILYGIERMPTGKRRSELATKASLILSQLPCFELPAEASGHYARLKAQQQRLGLSPTDNDLWIAAICLEFGATLISRDGDFARIPGFAVEDWSK